jgi:hypothetical protein
MQFATIKGLRIEKYTLQSQNWRESAKTNKTLRLITARRNSATAATAIAAFAAVAATASPSALSADTSLRRFVLSTVRKGLFYGASLPTHAKTWGSANRAQRVRDKRRHRQSSQHPIACSQLQARS